MGTFILFVLIVMITVVVVILSALRKISAAVFGKSSFSDSRKTYDPSSGATKDSRRDKKIFSRNEGEYVVFEELKD